MHVVIAGGSGFLGRYLAAAVAAEHGRVTIVSRKKDVSVPYPVVTWNDLEQSPELLADADAVVNLAGETIDQRWTRRAKDLILRSRLEATRRIAELVQSLSPKPQVVVQASAVGYYGPADNETVFDETSPPGMVGFLTEVARRWEQEADSIRGTRLVVLRTGVVLAADGGALQRMILPFRFGLGGPIGSGRQPVSWIHVDDYVRLVLFCLHHPEMTGPVNATAPHPVAQRDMAKTIARMLGRPLLLHIPELPLRIMLGERADIVLSGQRVVPTKALTAGFTFRYPTIEAAIQDLLGRQAVRPFVRGHPKSSS